MTRARVIMASFLLVAMVCTAWPSAVQAEAASWVPRAGGRPAHPKLSPMLENGPSSSAAPVVVRVTGDRPSDVAAAVAQVGGTVRTTVPGHVLASVSGDRLAALADDGRITRVTAARRLRPTATSQGVSETGASTWQAAGLDGSGVKLAIVDLGFQQLTTEQAAQRLPLLATTKSFCSNGIGGNTDHGTAVAEIAHQMAPNAQLYLVCIEFDDDVVAAEQYLAAQGVSIVNASFSDELGGRGDGSGVMGDAVAAGRRAGQLWSVAAGNDADRHYNFVANDADGDGAVEFAPGALDPNAADSSELYRFSLLSTGTIDILMKWDAWPVTNQEFGICMWTAGAPLGAFLGCQPGGQETSPGDPVSGFFASGMPAGSYVLAVTRGPNTSITPRIDMYFEGDEARLQRVSASGSIGEPASSPSVMAVGAHNVNSGGIEGFSSQGPTIDGRTKPDLTAPDGVSNDIFNPFFGTSASAPHAAGAAALVKQAIPSATPAQIQTFLSCRATDSGNPGIDNTYGYGRLALGAPPDAAFANATRPALVFNNAVFERFSLCTGSADSIVLYGDPGDVVLLCDWDGNGTRTPGVFRNGMWYLRNAPGNGPADVPAFGYGDPGDVPVCGHWGGPGKAETPGVFRNGTWFLRNSNTTGVADQPPVGYGDPGDVPVVGDWNGDGTETLGVFRNGTWFLRNSNTTGIADQPPVGYGDPGDKPVPGDWDGNGTTTLGVFRNGLWFLRNNLGGGVADLPPFFFGGAGGLRPQAWR